jgi:trk system potassium uptake protein TrkA
MNIIIVGAGDIGYQLCKRLSMDKHNITLIETNSDMVKRAQDQLDARIIEGSGTNLENLTSAGIANCNIFAALSNNDEVNLLAGQMAKKSGVETVIARVRSVDYLRDDHIMAGENTWPDFIIQPELETARDIVKLIRQSSATDIIEFEDGLIQLIGLRLDKGTPIVNTPLKDIGEKLGNPPMRVLAIKRRQFTIIPKGDDLLLEGDQIYIICQRDYTSTALQFFGKTNCKMQNVMIIGGGLVGQNIAKMISNEVSVKIIESDEKKSQFDADILPNSLVINGDGSDLDLLTFEGLQDMDEFIAVTGDDETNIITSLVAQHVKVSRTVTLVRKMDYLPLISTVGLDAVVSKQMITVNAIQKYIRRQQVAFYAEIPGVDAEIVEFIASEKSKITKKPLFKTSFPKNAILGAIIKENNKLEIPQGSSHVQAGDKVIVFSMPSAIKDVEKLFQH